MWSTFIAGFICYLQLGRTFKNDRKSCLPLISTRRIMLYYNTIYLICTKHGSIQWSIDKLLIVFTLKQPLVEIRLRQYFQCTFSNMETGSFKLIKKSVLIALIIYNALQFSLSFHRLITSWNDSIQLTFIDADNNKVFRHPLYTVSEAIL